MTATVNDRATEKQVQRIVIGFKDIRRSLRLEFLSECFNRPISSANDLTMSEAHEFISAGGDRCKSEADFTRVIEKMKGAQK